MTAPIDGIRYMQIEATASGPKFNVVMRSFPEVIDGERRIGKRIIHTLSDRATAEAAARVIAMQNGLQFIPDGSEVITIVRKNPREIQVLMLSDNRVQLLFEHVVEQLAAIDHTDRQVLIMPSWVLHKAIEEQPPK